VVRAQMNANSAEVRRLNVGDIIQISQNTVAINNCSILNSASTTPP
jgi:hypothetical protein